MFSVMATIDRMNWLASIVSDSDLYKDDRNIMFLVSHLALVVSRHFAMSFARVVVIVSVALYEHIHQRMAKYV